MMGANSAEGEEGGEPESMAGLDWVNKPFPPTSRFMSKRGAEETEVGEGEDRVSKKLNSSDVDGEKPGMYSG